MTVSLRGLGVQIVLYDSDPGQQRQLAAGLSATLRHARSALGLKRVAVRYGDCSPQSVLDADDEAAIRAALSDVADEVTCTFFAANLGSAGGSNALAAQGGEDVIWVLNPDTYPAPTAAAELLAALADPSVAVAEGRQIPVEHPKAYDPRTGDTSWASGFGSMYRRTAFDDVGGFDPHFFPLYCDDVDLSWRLRLAGWRVVQVPRAAIVHDVPIAGDGAIRWSDHAARSSHLARLWLYHRYGRPDLAAAFVEAAAATTDPVLADALREYEQRSASGDVPDEVPDAATVATFVDGRYAHHRFGYGA